MKSEVVWMEELVEVVVEVLVVTWEQQWNHGV